MVFRIHEKTNPARRVVKGSVPEFSYLYLHLSIMVFIDLLQSPLQPLQFRLPFPLQPANGLHHSRFVSHPQPLAHPAPPRRGVLAQPPRQHFLFPNRRLEFELDAWFVRFCVGLGSEPDEGARTWPL